MYYADRSIILTRRVFREDDLFISAYSEKHGKVVAVATGGKKILSKLAGHLEPVSLSYLNLVKGKNIDRLIGAENITVYKNIKNDLEKIEYTRRFLGWLEQLILEGHPDKRIFGLLLAYLDFLENSEQNINKYLLAEIVAGFKLLHLLGFNPSEKVASNQKKNIDFVVKNSLANIFNQKAVVNNFLDLKQILNRELRIHLH